MINRDEYLKALDIVEKYHEQVKREANGCSLLGKKELSMRSVYNCGFSTRTKNSLRYAEIETIYELVQFTAKDLMKFRIIGKKTVNEIEQFLDEHNVHLGMKITE